MGKKLRKKWDSTFKKDIQAQKNAIKVLKSYILDKTKTDDLGYMVEASRWLNDGRHEVYSYYLDEEIVSNKYAGEEYL
jgi:hypothetical protein